uniref:Inositol hexakisphosphate and diphosphoinositol-pentakisphosphate kinase n=1 Tax=Steinernema glaseri TaxID=37863 RepID=A0A1I7ZMN2_9BILA
MKSAAPADGAKPQTRDEPASSSSSSFSSADAPSPPSNIKRIIIGICAMRRKATSKPMRAIMSKILEYYSDYMDIVVFPEEVILHEPVEKWPLCDCLISFHSSEFPLDKAIEYERLRRPYVINDLHRQYDLLDRRKVFRTLARAGVEHPRHGVMIRGKDGDEGELKEYNDYIEVNGMVFNKPFVEKPLSAEDHNIYIYYPSSVGGGSQRLFRKINNRSSWYSNTSTVRREGSYIYEDFIPADGTDVKVYAVGPYYAHAEARKAPGLDGKVERDSDGKEVRYPVILSNKEKIIARKVVIAFGQTVCGFDLLRANGKSYVCDVNGFSFVKTSTKYYEDTAKILGNTILRRLASSMSLPWEVPYQADDPPLVSTPSGKIMELRCVLAVIRHGDRTPKQKMKVVVTDERFFDLFRKYDGDTKKEIKMKRPTQLMEVLALARAILQENQKRRNDLLVQLEACEDAHQNRRQSAHQARLEHELEQCDEAIKRWDQIRTVLEMYGHFSGINRKVQLKYLKPREFKTSDNEEHQQGPALLLILKWGGELTTAGHLQAEALGKLFRTLYPGIRRTDGKSCPEDTQGLGFLRLHSTYRHDLKIYASDEGRVQMTAAAFAKGLLALEGELTPILMQMVKSANTDGLLDDDCNARHFQSELKSFLHSALQVDRDFTPEDYENLNPSGLRAINNAMEFIKNPRKMCHEIAGYVQRMVEIIHWHKLNKPNRTLYLNETWDLAERRWSKELREFKKVLKNGVDVEFDISKIPDIYDNIKYDMEHNPDLCINNEGEFERMYLCVKNMADIVVPQEYGISEDSKICVAQRVCTPLLNKIKNDLHRCIQNEDDEEFTRLDPRASEGIATPLRHVRTRLYFTSESHIHTLMNLIRYGGLCSVDDKKWQRAMNFLSSVTEFNYMTQVVLMVYEDSRADSTKTGKERFHIELLFSPGLYPCFQTEKERIYETRFNKQNNQTTFSKTPREGKGSIGSISSMVTVGGGDLSKSESPSIQVSGSLTPTETAQSSASTCGGDEAKDQFLKPGKLSRSCSASKADDQKKNVMLAVGSSAPTSPNPDSDEQEATDDELNDHSVNLVVLGEVASKQYTAKDLARHSPPSMPTTRRKRHATGGDSSLLDDEREDPKEFAPNRAVKFDISDEPEPSPRFGDEIVPCDIPLVVQQQHPAIMKSTSDISCNVSHPKAAESLQKDLQKLDVDDQSDSNQATVGHGRGKWAKELVAESRAAMAAAAAAKKETEPAESHDASSTPRRSRFPYRFKHHTVNLIKEGSEVDDRLISTDVLMGKSAIKRMCNNPAVLSTAVIARSSSAPRLQTYKEEDDIPMAEIRRFWPPLRSLETMHDNVKFVQFDEFLEKLMTNRTPLPSPPRTPLSRQDSATANSKEKQGVTLARTADRLESLSRD